MIDISVIVPTRNRVDLLDKTLASLIPQTLNKNNFEIIVVDNGSTDNTKHICEKYKDTLNLQYIFEPQPGLHEGRHTGFKAAKSELLTFCDDDIEAFPSWLKTIVDTFNSDRSIALVGGKNYPKFETSPPDWILDYWNTGNELGKILSSLSILDFGDEIKEISPFYIFGCNYSIRKKVLQQCEGFHPDGMPFDLIRFRGDGETYVSQFIADNGYKAIYHPDASVYHFVSSDRLTKKYFNKRYYIQGISDAYTFLRKSKSEKYGSSALFSSNKFWNYFNYQQFKRIIKRFLSAKNKVKVLTDKEIFEKEKRNSYREGYNYLLSCYKNDPEIREWVHKKNYL